MKPILVTASTMMELSDLVRGTSAQQAGDAGRLPLFRGELAGREILLAQTGIGKANAAGAATLLLERFDPEFLLNTGCGGAFHGCGLSVGDVAIADGECFGDEGVQAPGGWQGLELIGIPLFEGRGERLFNRIPVDPRLARKALEASRRKGIEARLGPFLTVSTCSGTDLQAAEMLRRFPGAFCENMEGAAVAQVAFAYGTPFLEVRGISNMVEERDLSRWDLRGAIGRVQEFLLSCLTELSNTQPFAL